jgi:penicillin-binding protein 1B
LKKFLLASTVIGSFIAGLIFIWALKVNSDIKASLEKGWFAKPVQIYTGTQEIRRLQKITANNLVNRFTESGWTERGLDQSIIENEFTLLPVNLCEERIDTELPKSASSCLVFKSSTQSGLVVLNPEQILEILLFSENEMQSTESVSLGGKLFAQFIDEKAVRQNFTSISQMPDHCLESILAIEDDKFLEHKGISPRSIARAFLRNILAGRLSEGGSTITQQLIKNKFLTNKKTLIRKAREAVMSILIEITVDKNKILESYLNIIYMGQDGFFEVRGFPAAAQFYFNKNINQLSLRECASLAGSVKGPGIYGPHKQEKNELRIKAVLDRMLELKWISEDEFKTAESEVLDVRSKNSDTFLAPYFVNAINAFIVQNKLDTSEGLKVYTTLSADHQKAAETVAQKRIKELKTKLKNPEKLENLIVSADPKTGEVLALVGGSNFQTSPYNRAILNFRPIGSLMKPFVYLSALIEDKELTPLSLISNEKYIYKDKFQTWEPANYNKSAFGGQVYLFQALMLSLNIPTARVGLEHTELSKIIELVKRFGVEDRLKAYPALILGTFEFYFLEVLQIFASLSQFGEKHTIHFVKKIEKLSGEVLYEFKPEPSDDFENKIQAAQVVGMLKNTLKYGTARSAQKWNLNGVYAGKTGTTSFHKDAWFAGFSKDHVAISWVGYDEGTGSKLSGAGQPLPVWLDYMKSVENLGQVADDFDWPEGVESKSYSTYKLTEDAKELYIPLPEDDIELVVEDKGWF